LGCTVDELCDSLAKQPTAELELERARFVRQRSLATNEVIYEDRDLLYRLNDAGIIWSDTPKVLTALGSNIDVEVAVELVNIPGVSSDRMEMAVPSRSLGDMLSLLYVAGKHHGIEPDYQLALGTMPIQELAALRSLMRPSFSPRRLAEFAAVAETTKLAIRARVVQTVSYSDYAKRAETISSRLGNSRVAAADRWPAPAAVLLRRYGHGFWEDALQAAGLSLPSADGVWFEIVSEQYLPAERWPISAGYLSGNNWSAPDEDFPNWYKDGIPHVEAGHQILEGFRYGRHCDDPRKLRWHTGQFASGPGPDGGVTLDDALAGVVQTIQNAA
jgi:hypothetical protein